MTRHEFKQIRLGLLLTQQELADRLGYRHKIRISEYERRTNPIPIPEHVADIMRRLAAHHGRGLRRGRLIRDWEHAA
jgi:transcriptional regulator with XRE-family HTH domain